MTLCDKVPESTVSSMPTPFYLFDEGIVHNRAKHLRGLMPAGTGLCYAMKANAFIVEQAARDTDRIEACSTGEVRVCQEVGVPDSKIVVSGVSKDADFIYELVSDHPQICRYTAESIRQFDLIERAAAEAGRRVPMLLRLTSGNQFGMSRGDLEELAARCAGNPHIELCGVQYFSGTQKTSLSRLERELAKLDRLVARLNEAGVEVRELEFGPGLPALYFEDADEADAKEDELASGLSELLGSLAFGGDVVLELGRAMAADCGMYATRVVDLKSNKTGGYAIVDGGKHQLVYYGNAMAMSQPPCRVVPARDGGEVRAWNICGSLCTSTDILVKQLEVADLAVGDAIVFERAGAYCMTEGISLFLSRDLPRVYLRGCDGTVRLARDRFETHPLNTPAVRR